MVVGFNHNFSYKGQVYHVQTEDSGIKNPHIITLLYRGGTILASKKTSYADIIKFDNLESVVEDLMKTQHREMLRLLKNGEFDSILDLPPQTGGATGGQQPAPAAEKRLPDPIAVAPVVAPAATPLPPRLERPVSPPVKSAIPPPPPTTPPQEESKAAPPSPATGLSLDDIILSYMVGEGTKK